VKLHALKGGAYGALAGHGLLENKAMRYYIESES